MIDLLSLNAPFKMGRFPLRGKGIVSLESKVRGLFSNNEIGVWYDPSDLSTMFQDAAGTLPVTGDGQPVGKILDKSGRGNHATQATTTARPLYKTDGTYHWLQFDGVDDSLSTAAINFTGTNKMSAFTGFRYTESGPRRPFATTPQGFEFRISYTGVGQIDMSHNLSGAEDESGMRSNPTTFPQNTKTVFSTVIDGDGTTWSTETPTGRVNGVQVLNNTFGTVNQTGNFPSATLSMSHGGNCPCNIYSLIVRGALSTAAEITAAETWVNGKTGAY